MAISEADLTKMKNQYRDKEYEEILGLKPDYTDNDLRKAYLKLSRKFHPDNNIAQPELSTAMFQIINASYETLKERRVSGLPMDALPPRGTPPSGNQASNQFENAVVLFNPSPAPMPRPTSTPTSTLVVPVEVGKSKAEEKKEQEREDVNRELLETNKELLDAEKDPSKKKSPGNYAGGTDDPAFWIQIYKDTRRGLGYDQSSSSSSSRPSGLSDSQFSPAKALQANRVMNSLPAQGSSVGGAQAGSAAAASPELIAAAPMMMGS